MAAQGAQPAMTVEVWAEERQGYVSVRDNQGNELQNLSCALLRDHPKPTKEEWAAVRQQFVKQFVVEDFDSDGFLDLAGVREFGAKWARYCVWLYDPRQRLFTKDFLSEQMELLMNPTRAGTGMVSSSYAGPANPWLSWYRIVERKDARPVRQLVAAYSCLVETGPNGETPAAVVITRFAGPRPVAERQRTDGMGMAEALQKCQSGFR